MARTKGSYSLSANIEINAAAPLDARERVATLADLTAEGSFPYHYVGMETYVVETGKKYRLVGSNPTISANWQEIEEGGSGTGGHTIEDANGTMMNSRSDLQFKGVAKVSDDSENDRTVVDVPEMNAIDLNEILYPLPSPKSLDVSDLEDVALENLSDGQILKYDSVHEEWKNVDDNGGHIIKDSNGTSFSQRSNLQFKGGATVNDDSENDKTVVELPDLMSQSDLEEVMFPLPSPNSPDISDLNDVNINNLTNGQILKWDETNSEWVNDDESGGGASAIEDLTDVDLTNLSNGQILKYNSTNQEWVNSNELVSELADVSLTNLSDGQVLKYDSANHQWVNANESGGGGGGGSGDGYTKTILYDSGSDTSYAEYNTPISLLDDVTNYDMLMILTSTPGDNGLVGNGIEIWADANVVTNYKVVYQGYHKRWWCADFSQKTSFTYTGSAPDESASYQPKIYKVYGIKIEGGGGSSTVDTLDDTARTEANTDFELAHSINDYDFILIQIHYNGGSGNSWTGSRLIKASTILESRTGYDNTVWIDGGNNDRAMKVTFTDDTHYRISAAGSANTLKGVYGIKLSSGGGSGGASSVSELTDVDLTDLTDGQVLKYDATNQKWVNADESGGGGTGGSGYSEEVLWNYVTDNSGTIPYGPITITLPKSIDNFDAILVELRSSSSDSGDWSGNGQFIVSVETLNTSGIVGRINHTSFDDRSSNYYIHGTTFQKIKDNKASTNGLLRVVGIKYDSGISNIEEMAKEDYDLITPEQDKMYLVYNNEMVYGYAHSQQGTAYKYSDVLNANEKLAVLASLNNVIYAGFYFDINTRISTVIPADDFDKFADILRMTYVSDSTVTITQDMNTPSAYWSNGNNHDTIYLDATKLISTGTKCGYSGCVSHLFYGEANNNKIYLNNRAYAGGVGGSSGSTSELIQIESGTGATTQTFSFDKVPKRITVSYNSPDNWYGYWQFLWGDEYVVFSCKAKSVSISGNTTGMGQITYGADGKSFTITGHNNFGSWNQVNGYGQMLVEY